MSLLVPSMPWNAADHGAILDALKKADHGAVKRGIVHDIRTTKRALLTILGENGMADLPFAARTELFGDF